MKIKMNMAQLSEGDIKFLSIVRRSANQTPFKKMASDEGENMGKGHVDLMDVSTVLKGEKKKKGKASCEVTGVVVKKMADMEKIKAVIQKAGFSVDKPVEDGKGSIFYAQTENPEKDAHIGRVSENLAVVTKSYEPWMADILTFSERLGLDGYYGALLDGAAALRTVLSDCVYKADTHEDMTSKCNKAIEDFAAYAKGVMQAVPSTVYKMDEELTSIYKEAPVATEPKVEEKKAEVQKAADAVAAAPAAGANATTCTACGKPQGSNAECAACKKPVDGTGADSAAKDPAVQTLTTTTDGKGVPAPDSKGAAAVASSPAVLKNADEPKKEPAVDPMVEIKKMIADLGAQVATVQKSVDEKIAALAADVNGKVEAVVKKADEVEKKLSGTVLAPPAGTGDKPVVTKGSEEKDEMGDGFYDSAFDGKRRNR